jgi:hypothetical protein
MPYSGMLRRVALVRTDVYEELSAFIIRVVTLMRGFTMKSSVSFTAPQISLQRSSQGG